MLNHPHAGLVYIAARRVPVSYDDRTELIGAGFLGLAEAEAKFDPARGIPFAPFARKLIRWRIVDQIRKECGRRPVCECGRVIGKAFAVLTHCPNCGCDLREPTAAESKVLELLARGKNNEQIASALGVTVGTVRNQILSIHRKLESRIGEGSVRVLLAKYWWERKKADHQ